MRKIIIGFIFSIIVMQAYAQPVIAYEAIATGLNNPIDIVTAPGDSRLYIAQQNGLIRIWNGTQFLDFLDLSAVITNPAANEQGLLSIAFHPDYNINRYFFVWYTAVNGNVTLARYQRNAGNPDIADAGSAQVLLSIAKPGTPYYTNHNGAKLIFGADGMLYIGTGDGGSGGDPFNNAQDGSSLLGKMLRINVNSFASAAPYYDIPADNPFISPVDGILDEIYAVGLRNPWRWSFDRSNGDMWIADVGQGSWEEVNWLPAGSQSGVNYGWRCYEGAHVYNSGCSPTDTVSPVFEYGHNSSTGGYSITGGYVYRGTEFTSLQGYYITADYVTGNLWLIKPNGSGGWNSFLQNGLVSNISSFGEGADGTLYSLRRNSGTIYKVIVTSVVPVAISGFKATRFNGYHQLSWTANSEINTVKYHIEYSSNNQQFYPVGTLAARGSGNDYKFKNFVQNSQQAFYRLAIEDIDGSLQYSATVYLKAGPEKNFKIYPTIVTNHQITIELNGPAKILQLSNSTGQVVYQQNLLGRSGKISIALPHLPKGLYIIHIAGNDLDLKEKIIIR